MSHLLLFPTCQFRLPVPILDVPPPHLGCPISCGKFLFPSPYLPVPTLDVPSPAVKSHVMCKLAHLFPCHLSKKWKNACPLSRRITPMSSVKKMEQEKEGTCALWLFVSPKSSAPGIFPIAKISEPPKSRTCPSHLPFCQKGIFESYVMCLVSGRFCTYPTLCHLPLIYLEAFFDIEQLKP